MSASHCLLNGISSDVTPNPVLWRLLYNLTLFDWSIAVGAGWPLLYAEEGAAIGLRWPKGMLLHGPPGCGKTLVARSVAAEFDAVLYEVSAASVFGAYTGMLVKNTSICILCKPGQCVLTVLLYATLSTHVQHLFAMLCRQSTWSHKLNVTAPLTASILSTCKFVHVE